MLLSCSLMTSHTGNKTTDGILLSMLDFKKQNLKLSARYSKGKPYVLVSEHTNQLTFPEFHFETEAKVDFPSACI